jgi:hypothetical protein
MARTPFKLRSGNSPLHESFFKAGGKRKRRKQLEKIEAEEKEALQQKLKTREKEDPNYIDPDEYKNQKAYESAIRDREMQKETEEAEKRKGVVSEEDIEGAKKKVLHGEVKEMKGSKDVSGISGKKVVKKTAQDIANERKQVMLEKEKGEREATIKAKQVEKYNL